MIKFALVIPGKNLIDVAFEVLEDHNRLDREFAHETYRMEEIITTNDTCHELKVDADVIITRGLLAHHLNRFQQDIPVIEITVPATDILRAINRSDRKYGTNKLGIIAYGNMLTGVNDLVGLTDKDIKLYELGPTWNAPAHIDRALRDGCEAILAGYDTCRYATMINVKNVFLRTGRDAFWQAVTAAKRMATLRRTEQEKNTRMQIILDSSKEGYLSIDPGKRIRMINKRAESILKLSSPVLNMRVEEAPFPIDFKKLLLVESECTNELYKYHDTMLTVDKRAIRVDNAVMGMVVTCQEVGGIQNLEGSIRKKIYSKGHVAKATFADIVGESPAMARMLEMAKKCSLTDSNVLLIGKSGTGKEILAQSMHAHSRRGKGPFVAVNCAAIPDTLLESELFGYEAGAFSGAQRNGKPGFFELAHTGTIFLDEVGEIPPQLQAKLLRVIQEREVIRLGGENVMPVDIRVISATNQDLERLVRENRFREDLFFRLDVLRVDIPPLAERRDDIPLLAEKHLRDNFPAARMEDGAKELLKEQEWSGNVRQLFNICERLAVLRGGEAITAADVKAVLTGRRTFAPEAPVEAGSSSGGVDTPPAESMRIRRALEQCRYHRGRAAEMLGINRSTLWRKIREYGL